MSDATINKNLVIGHLARMKRFSHLSKEKIGRLVEKAEKDPDSVSKEIRNYIMFAIQSSGATDNEELLKEIIDLNEEIMTLIDYKTMRAQLERSWAPVWRLSDYLTMGQQGTVPASLRCSFAQLMTLSISEMMMNQEPIIYNYKCTACGHEFSRGASTFNGPRDHLKVKCPFGRGAGVCGHVNSPIPGGTMNLPVQVGRGTFEALFGEGKQRTQCYVVSFATNLTIGEQLVAAIIYKPDNASMPVVWVIAADVPLKKEIPGLLDSPDMKSAISAIDSFIEKEAHTRIEGAQLQKELLFLQAMSYHARKSKKANFAIIGMKDIGKSFVFRPYQQIYYEPAKWTRQTSLSIASLRGTRIQIFIGNKEQWVQSDGFLSLFENIFVDEMLADADAAGKFSEKSLMTELKGYLLDDVVDYSKAGSDGVERQKKAIMNIASNVPPHYLLQYKKEIEREHKRIINMNTQAGGVFKTLNIDAFSYDSGLDYLGPLEEYYSLDESIGKAVENVRRSKATICWQCGIEDATLKRFPILVYVRGDKPMSITAETMAFNAMRIKDQFLARELANKTFKELAAVYAKRIEEIPQDVQIQVTMAIKDAVKRHYSSIETENIDVTTQEEMTNFVLCFMASEDIKQMTERVLEFIEAFFSINRKYVHVDRLKFGVLPT